MAQALRDSEGVPDRVALLLGETVAEALSCLLGEAEAEGQPLGVPLLQPLALVLALGH